MTEYRAVIALGLLLTAIVSPSPLGAATRESKLLRTLSGRSEAIRMRAIDSIGADGASKKAVLDDLVAAVRKHAEETSDEDLARPSTIRLIYLIGGIDDPRVEALLIELLDSPHLGLAMISADVLGKNKFYGAIEHLKKQVERPDYAELYGFRFNLVRALAQMEHPDAVEFLSELRPSLDGQLAYQLDRLLAEVNVGHFQGDQERFDEWKGGDKRESIFQNAGFEPESLKRVSLGRDNKYYGIDIRAKRLMFIIDNSGSMRDYWGGATRLEMAKSELIHAIEDLPPDAKFAIVSFHTAVHKWRSELIEASDENKREAIQFVRRLGYGVKTNTYGALRQSLAFDDELEAVFLLTDGRPTIGEIISTAGIIHDILHRNRFRHLNFNTIGIGVQGPTENFLRTLAEQTNGEFRSAP